MQKIIELLTQDFDYAIDIKCSTICKYFIYKISQK